jgi:tetratricopeptide (TPR) repeat protein
MIKKVKTINQLFTLFKDVEKLKNPIYRGHSSADYELKSSAYRRLEKKYDISTLKRNISSYHEQLVEEFKANKYHQSAIGELCDLEILAKLQHYGAATCFLDFSKNIAVALWFACSSKNDKDGRLYILKNIQDIINYKIINSEQLRYDISMFFKDFVENGIENELVNSFLLWEPPYLSERILQQDSIFLFSKKEDTLDNDEILVKVDISKSIKKDILKILNSLFNINKKTIYKDFHGFALSHAQNELIDFIDDGEKFFDMANQYFQSGNNEKAEEYYLKAESDLESDSENLIDLYLNMAIIYKNRVGYENLQKALEYQNKAVKISEKVLDANHPNLATSYNNLSFIYQELDGEENLQKALEYQNKALEIREKVLDANHPSLAISYNNLSSIYQDLSGEENLQKALEYQNKALEIRKKVLDANHPNLATSYNNLAMIYKDLGGEENLQKALEYQNKALEIRKKVLDANHPNLGESYNNLSIIYQNLGGEENLQKALEYQNKDIKISEKVLDANHPSLATSYNNLSFIYQKLGGEANLQKALMYQNKALEIGNKSLQPEHPYLKIFTDNKEMILSSLQKYKSNDKE